MSCQIGTKQSMKTKLSNPISVPSHYKNYKVEERKIMVTMPERTLTSLGVSYDEPEDTKKVDLASPGEEPKPVYIATDLRPERKNTSLFNSC